MFGGVIEPGHLPDSLGVVGESISVSSRGAATVKEMERIMILDALQRHDGNRKAAAQELGFHKSTFFRKIKAFDIDLPARDGRAARD